MSHLQYYGCDSGDQATEPDFWCSQAVHIGDRIECGGQGGCDPKTGEIHRETNAQIDQAFAKVDMNLKDAGGKGWEQVFRVNSYHLPLNDEALDATTCNFKRYMPNRRPIWTCVGVTRLFDDDSRVEIEVEAHDPCRGLL